MPCPHKREQPAETVSMSPDGAASAPLDCITIRASINGLAERLAHAEDDTLPLPAPLPAQSRAAALSISPPTGYLTLTTPTNPS